MGCVCRGWCVVGVALAGVEKARDAEKAEKQTIEHKVFNNVCEAHDSSGFQHFL